MPAKKYRLSMEDHLRIAYLVKFIHAAVIRGKSNPVEYAELRFSLYVSKHPNWNNHINDPEKDYRYET